MSVNPAMPNVAPVATVTAAVSASRFDAASVRLPALTFTVAAPDVPASVDAPPAWTSVPAPRLAFTAALVSV